MLIIEDVKTKWSSLNIAHYKSLGYRYTKRGDTLLVKSSDLMKSSQMKVNVKCDYCGDIVIKVFMDYNRSKLKGNGDDCCKKCAILKNKETLLSKYGYDNLNQALDLAKIVGDKRRTDESLVLDEFARQNLIIIDFKYVNCNTPIKFICPKHKDYGIQTTHYKGMSKSSNSCRMCQGEAMSLDNHPGWKGGISSLEAFFKRKISKWKNDSINNCNGKCVITGKPSKLVHHLYGFSNILKETMEDLNMDIKFSIHKYSVEDLELIQLKLLENHYKYPLGVCLSLDVHLLFHHHYKYGGNTPEQFDEFKQRCSNGEFKEALSA